MTNPIAAIQRKLERWELNHLRQLVSELAERLERAEEEARYERELADHWHETAMNMIHELQDAGETVGMTQEGAIGVQQGKLFRLPYARESYICFCGADTRDECTCDQEQVVSTSRNSHTVSPEFVRWLAQQQAPFTLEQAGEALGLSEIASTNRDCRVHALIAARSELNRCGAVKTDDGRFISPSADALASLPLRLPAGGQLPPAGCSPSQASTTVETQPSPLSPADRRSAQADQSGTQSH